MSGLETLKSALAGTGYPFRHYAWSHAPCGTYGTYGEEDENRLAGCNRTAEMALVVYVNLFTKDDSETPRQTVEGALDGIPCAWTLNTIQFEQDSGYIHIEWVVEI